MTAPSVKKPFRTNPKQAVLPLRGGPKQKKNLDHSKLVFQLKSELGRLQQRDREWKLMFNMLGHDLREPLVTLEGFTKLLEEEDCSPHDRRRYLKIIREAINSLHLLVGSLQSVSKLYHDASEFVPVSLREILNSVLVSLSQQIKREKGTIHLNFDDIAFHGDPIRLYQIFLNLLANSLKYHKKETAPIIHVEAKVSGPLIRVSISDNGVGMNADDLKKIFEPFTRLDDGAGSREGMGMGLSIVKRIAESFGGRVSVKSQQGIGTTFTVSIPRSYPQSGAQK